MAEVTWRVAGVYKADAQKVFDEIGTESTTPEAVLEKARDENSELHKCFEWDDGIAAEKYRLHQAGDIIRMLVYIPHEKDEQPTRVLSYTPQTKYKPTIQFVVQTDEYQELLRRAKQELIAFQTKYKRLTELEEVFKAIELL